MNIKEWNRIQRWIDSLCKRSAAKREFYIKRFYPREIRSEYFFFNEKNNNSIISGFTIVIYDYDYHVYATKFFKFKESEPISFLTFKIEVFLKSKGAWEEGYEFNVKQS